MEQNKPRRITVAEMSPHVHTFKIGENKVNKIAEWLCSWIENSLMSGKIKPYDFLPTKGDLAFHIGVSLGTMQNVFRTVEDRGYVESKQRIGTFVKNKKSDKSVEKLTSKREKTCEIIKEFIKNNKIKTDELLPSSRELAKITEISNTTIRLAINHLASVGILEKKNQRFFVKRTDFEVQNVNKKTLVQKIAVKIRQNINNNLKTGEKLLSNTELSQKYNVSIKTIHDALKILAKEGVIKTRRGHYGTVVTNNENKNEFYFYEKVEIKIKDYINKNCQVGDKLPSIKEFSEEFNVSPKTVKKALDNLLDDGYIRLMRGRYGGTFVTDIPSENQGYRWLAINPDFVEN